MTQERLSGTGTFASCVEALTRQLAEELEDDGRRVTGDTLAAVAQKYEDAQGFGPNALRALAQKFYHSRQCSPPDVHRALAALPFSLIVTTCHDDLLSRALRDAGKAPLEQRYHLRGDKRENPEFALSGSSNAPVVYHLFGDASEPGSLVLSENDLLDLVLILLSYGTRLLRRGLQAVQQRERGSRAVAATRG